MKTDRELLELAAKAYGLRSTEWGWDGFGLREYEVSGVHRLGFRGAFWNPMDDDGQALQLAVMDNVFDNPRFFRERDEAMVIGQMEAGEATRFAIVTVVAERQRAKEAA